MAHRNEQPEELQIAFDEYRDGTFIKHKKHDSFGDCKM